MALLLAPGASAADPAAAINAIRATGCGEHAATAAVQRHERLDAVARDLSRQRLSAAIERAGYPAAASTSFHVRGSPDDAAIRRILLEQYCAAVTDPRYAELGWFQDGNDTWIVLASRTVPPSALPNDPHTVALRVLELVNAARAVPRRCGRESFGAAAPLSLSAELTAAASLHARDMALRGSLGHEGADGTTSGERITRSGYSWQSSGENVAAGQRTAEAVVAAWLDSPGHCASIMAPHFKETGVSFALAPANDPPIYWTQVFATPRSR
jgi:uncharacterized protein YkwD